MTDETPGDPPSEPDRPIAPDEAALPFERGEAEAERAPEPEPTRQAPIFQEPIYQEPIYQEPVSYPPAAPEPAKRSVLMPVLGVIGFLILAAAIGYLWVRPVPSSATAGSPPNDSGAVTALQSDVAALKSQLAALDTRETSDVAALHAAIAALPASAPSAPSAATAPSASSGASSGATPNAPPAATASNASSAGSTPTAPPAATASNASSAGSTPTAPPAVTASSGTPASAPNAPPAATVASSAPATANAGTAASPQNPAQSQSQSAAPAVLASDAALVQMVASLSDRLNQLQSAEATEAQQTQSLPSAADVSHLATRVDTVSEKASRDDTAIRQDLSLVQQQLESLSGQAQTLSKNAAALPQLTAQSDRLGQIVRAQEALRAGLPLGTIANAPKALSRFADTAPPTEAALRLSFADASQAADKAGEPTPDQGPFWHRIWLRAQALVMVRQGDHVVLGDPTSAILAHAQTELDAGDLSGTLAVLDTLSGPAAAAMAAWETQARSLLQAREALTQMAAG